MSSIYIGWLYRLLLFCSSVHCRLTIVLHSYEDNKLRLILFVTATCTTGDNHIYLAGGAIRKINYRGPFITEGVSQNLFLFDKNFGSWQVRAKMLQGRCQFGLVVVDG